MQSQERIINNKRVLNVINNNNNNFKPYDSNRQVLRKLDEKKKQFFT